eukprot:scaffold315_cov218-Chaetoceros_neogracile.AAC.4
MSDPVESKNIISEPIASSDTVILSIEEEKKDDFEQVSVIPIKSEEQPAQPKPTISMAQDDIDIDDNNNKNNNSNDDVDDDGEPRRSGRKRKSTTMMIQGHIVKSENNYVLKGDSYVFGAFDADADKQKNRKRAPNKKPRSATPRKRAAHLDKRLKHNSVIKERMGRDEANRLDFMAKNMDILGPFIDDKVKATLLRHKQSKPSIHATDPASELILGIQPDSVTTTLRDYQLVGLDWMVKMHKRGMPFVLGDEMGLGKTLQTIALIAHLKQTSLTTSGPSLVICPLSVLYSWCHEVQKHAPSLKHFRLHASDPKDRESQKATMIKDILQYDLIITTYEMAKSPQILSLIRSTYFNLCVLDEGHVIKNTQTNNAEAVRKIHCQNKVILTGTPLQNNLVELYAILNFLYPAFFTKPDYFANAFDIGQNRIDPKMLLQANKLLGLFMIRRLKEEVEKLMPKKIETKVSSCRWIFGLGIVSGVQWNGMECMNMFPNLFSFLTSAFDSSLLDSLSPFVHANLLVQGILNE